MSVIASGLHQKRIFGKDYQAIENVLEQIGYVQIDTISVVQRAHHHVLWSRVPHYSIRKLTELQFLHKSVIEYWAHAAAYLPMKDYRFTLPRKKWFKDKKDNWPKSRKKIKAQVLERIRLEGPLMARDFKGPTSGSGGWWNWKPAKLALERLYLEGDILITHRDKFQKVYDLPERHLPPDVNRSLPGKEEYANYLIQKAVRAFGIVNSSEISYLRPGMHQTIRKQLMDLCEAGSLIACHIKGIDSKTYYTTQENLDKAGVRITRNYKILSPFDNILIQRKRTKEIFGFDYQIECYVPKEKRQYGYFSLPILHGIDFIGRVDCKAERKSKKFHIKNLVFESHINLSNLDTGKLAKSFEDFAKFNNCTEIVVHRIDPPILKTELKKQLSV